MSDTIPIDRWGEDHWGTLAYVETRVVDHDGLVVVQHMRCHPGVHRDLAHEGSFGPVPPTRLSDGTAVDLHDDWSCMEDAAALGLVTRTEGERVPRTRYRSQKFTLTSEGQRLAAALRAHKASGGEFATFRPVSSAEATPLLKAVVSAAVTPADEDR